MKEKIKFTKLQRWLEFMSIAVLLFLFVFLSSNWSSLPARIPLHFNANGLAESLGSKNSLLVLPVICTAMYALLTVVCFFPKTWNIPVKLTDENRNRVYTVTRSFLVTLKFLLLLNFTVIERSMVKMQPLDGLFVFIVLAGVFGVMTGFTVKIIKVSKPR